MLIIAASGVPRIFFLNCRAKHFKNNDLLMGKLTKKLMIDFSWICLQKLAMFCVLFTEANEQFLCINYVYVISCIYNNAAVLAAKQYNDL